MSDADFGNIERKVLVEDRPWTDRRCGYFSVLCVLFFMCSAIGLGATGAPRYDPNSDNEIEGVNEFVSLAFSSENKFLLTQGGASKTNQNSWTLFNWAWDKGRPMA